jgi:glyoxylase-like metal-dependent hydrolase (beta-lactamase superfamily II)
VSMAACRSPPRQLRWATHRPGAHHLYMVFGAVDAVLVDPLMTVPEATVLADWVALHGCRLTTIYVTHGHGDHYLGLPAVLDGSRKRGRSPPPGRCGRCASRPAQKLGTTASGRDFPVKSPAPSRYPSSSA